MGIQINYQPAPSMVGPAAYDIGLGEALRQKQLEEQARQQRDLALQEQRREFDITNQRQYDQFGEQQYQFDVGQQSRGQQFGEGQRQFDAEQQLKQQQLDDARSAQAFNQQIAGHREKLARYGIMQQAAAQQANQYGRLAEEYMQGQYGLAREQLQQQGQDQRAGQEMQGRYGMQHQEQVARAMQADWKNVQNNLPKLDDSERQDLLAQFQHKWESANIPMPTELPQPQIPDWQNPDKQLESARQMDPTVPWQINSKGELQAPRGWSYGNSKQGITEKNAHELEKAQIASQHKAAEAEVKKQEAFDMSQLKAMDAEMKAAQSEDTHIQSQRHAEDLHYQTMQNNLADLQLKIANAKSKPPTVNAEGKESPTVDTSEMEKTVADYKKQIEDYKAKRVALEASGPFNEQAAATDNRPAWEKLPDSRYAGVSEGSLSWSPLDKTVQMGVKSASGAIETWVVYPVTSREDIAKLKKGNKFILPDGRTGTRN